MDGGGEYIGTHVHCALPIDHYNAVDWTGWFEPTIYLLESFIKLRAQTTLDTQHAALSLKRKAREGIVLEN